MTNFADEALLGQVGAAGKLVLGCPGGIATVRWPRFVPRDADCAASLKKRTLTNLYNERPAWLDLAHEKLDAAVFATYGWDAGISDEELLQRLLWLNVERASAH